ncbi:hypothetical protein [Methanolapillus millepedarum]|uniref:Uncharacterized protein n=1 Tax=Methanolapillus millepedarum TaxID=3028296 RepID=A0AA97A515_9EURY|nr:hypothetical protein MsAc7_17860 [Methanosarcinaceae archaeon Ac7]
MQVDLREKLTKSIEKATEDAHDYVLENVFTPGDAIEMLAYAKFLMFSGMKILEDTGMGKDSIKEISDKMDETIEPIARDLIEFEIRGVKNGSTV